MPRLVATLIAIALGSSTALAQQTPAEQRLLRWMDQIAQQQLDGREAQIAAVNTRQQAEARQKTVRAKMLELIGGLPDYDGPLNAKTTGRVENERFTVENVIYESLPQFPVTANLYLPKSPGRHPAVLFPMGHWDEGKLAAQRMAANLAAKGFVVLVFDPVGQGERFQAYDPNLGASAAGGTTDQHFMAGAQSILIGESFARYRIWDAKRSLDYLVSRPEVDAERIGCTGCSGGGTVTTFISALDDRIKVAAPSCYMQSFRVLFSGSVGDSEQSWPGFISSGLDQTDFVEVFAPKPWLITSTMDDFFTPEGARIVYEEARRWYRHWDAGERVHWLIGPGPHGTPLEVREAVYEWMIRWLNEGKGDPSEEKVELYPPHKLRVTESGQVSQDGEVREMDDIIRDQFARRREGHKPVDAVGQIAQLAKPVRDGKLSFRVEDEKPNAELLTQRILIETEPGLELSAALLVPRSAERKPAVLVVETGETPSPLARQIARKGNVVLAMNPRGIPDGSGTRRALGDWLPNTRAWLIGLNLPALRAYDIRRGVELLAAREDVDPAAIRGVARGASGVWLLMAAATGARFQRIWLDGTPASLRAALDNPLHRQLHTVVVPGLLLNGDLEDLAKAYGREKILWADPSDWMGKVKPAEGQYRYSVFGEDNGPFIEAFLR